MKQALSVLAVVAGISSLSNVADARPPRRVVVTPRPIVRTRPAPVVVRPSPVAALANAVVRLVHPPKDAVVIRANGRVYYRTGDVYYLETVQDGETVYIESAPPVESTAVVKPAPAPAPLHPQVSYSQTTPSETNGPVLPRPAIGTVVKVLPAGALYAPDKRGNIFVANGAEYMEIFVDGKRQFVVVR